LLFPCQAAFGSETGFPLWVEEKARIRSFFFCARRFGFFPCSFFFALSRSFYRSFYRFSLATSKAQKMCQRQPLFIWYGTKTYFLQAFS
jgi:hypothetical protein